MDPTSTVISQYGTSHKIIALIGSFFEWFSADTNFDLFYDDVWNIDTAQGFGLDLLGRRLDFVRPAAMDDATYRQCLLAKAFLNITDCTIPSINMFLRTFGGPRDYVIDGGGMALIYHFGSGDSAILDALIAANLLPRPAGVLASSVFPVSLGTEGGDTLVTEGGDAISTEG